MRLSQSNPVSGSALTSVWLGVVVVAALYFCREVLVPIALAILLSFVLSPLVRLLHRWRFPRGVAVAVVAFAAFSAFFGLGALMVSQVNELANDLPRYQSTLGDKIQTLRGVSAGSGVLEHASEVLQNLSNEIDKPKSRQINPLLPESPAPNGPISVEVKQPDIGPLQTIATLITPLIQKATWTMMDDGVFWKPAPQGLVAGIANDGNAFKSLAGGIPLQRAAIAAGSTVRRMAANATAPAILMGAVFGSHTSDGEMYAKVMDMPEVRAIEISLKEVAEPEVQRIRIVANERSAWLDSRNRGGARVAIVDAEPSRHEAVEAARSLGIQLAS